MIPISVLAQQECVMQEKAIAKMENIISEIKGITRDVSKFGESQLKCTVRFQARIDSVWHNVQGEYVWDGDRPFNEACGIAVNRAKKDLTIKVKPSTIESEEILVCNDDTKNSPIKIAKEGDIVDPKQLRPHPVYNNQFVDERNGAICKLFIDSSWRSKEKVLVSYQGVACKVSPTQWVVVDKF